MDVDSSNVDADMVFAVRTKPAENNKFKKRLGAKKAKKLEVDTSSEFVEFGRCYSLQSFGGPL